MKDESGIASSSQQKMNVLLNEYNLVQQRISTLFMRGEKTIGIGFSFVVVGMQLGLKDGVKEILLILPIAVILLMLYGVHMFTELSALGGYKKAIEERLNESYGNPPVVIWESRIAPQMHKLIVHNLTFFIYILFLLITIGYSLNTAWTSYPIIIFLILVIIELILIYGLINSYLCRNKAFLKAHSDTKKAFSGESMERGGE